MSRSTILFLLIAFCLGACVASAPAAPIQAAVTPTPASTPSPVPTPPVAELEEIVSPSCPPLEGELLSEIRALEAEVSQLRGLPALHAIGRNLVTTEEFRSRFMEEFFVAYTEKEAQADADLFTMLGLLPEALDLRQLYIDLFDEQLAGFYDPEADELVIVCDDGFTSVARLTYVHEFVHSLQDQHYAVGHRPGYSDQACDELPRRCVATSALFEGDAVLLQEQWLRTLAPADDLKDLGAFFASVRMPVFESAPSFIQDKFTFPYLEGLFFVRSLYLKNGWEAVDDAYQNPPGSTEHILHPERYPWDTPVLLNAPDVSESGWSVSHQDILGEWGLVKMLERHISEDEASIAAGGWGGDVVQLLVNPEVNEQALVLIIQWDTMRDAHEFTAAYKAYGELRFGESLRSSSSSAEWRTGETAVLIIRQSNQTRIIMSPASALQTLHEAMPLPVHELP